MNREPLFRREPPVHCDVCRKKSERVSGIYFDFESYWNDDSCVIARHLFICADCASRAVRVAMGHEVSE